MLELRRVLVPGVGACTDLKKDVSERGLRLIQFSLAQSGVPVAILHAGAPRFELGG